MVYAGFWRRFAAVVIDSLIVLIPSIILGWILPYVGGLVAMFLYYPFFESSEAMGTPGKLFMGMQVTNEAGGRLTFGQALARRLLTLVSSLMLTIGYLFNLFTPKRQCFHDLMVGSVVVHRQVSTNIDWVAVWTREFKRVFNIQDAPRTGTYDVTTSVPRSDDAPSWTGTPAGQPFEDAVKVKSAPAAAPAMDSAAAMQSIDQLHRLFQSGAISEAEFNAKKEELLRRV